jgi:hypothetical protein
MFPFVIGASKVTVFVAPEAELPNFCWTSIGPAGVGVGLGVGLGEGVGLGLGEGEGVGEGLGLAVAAAAFG